MRFSRQQFCRLSLSWAFLDEGAFGSVTVLRIWNACYPNMTLSEFKKKLGKDSATYDAFVRLQAWLVNHVLELLQENPDRDAIYITTWPSPTTIMEQDIHQVKWVKPRDEYITLKQYRATRTGEPADNGHRKEIAPDGTELVNLGNNGVWRKETSMIFQASEQRTVSRNVPPSWPKDLISVRCLLRCVQNQVPSLTLHVISDAMFRSARHFGFGVFWGKAFGLHSEMSWAQALLRDVHPASCPPSMPGLSTPATT